MSEGSKDKSGNSPEEEAASAAPAGAAPASKAAAKGSAAAKKKSPAAKKKAAAKPAGAAPARKAAAKGSAAAKKKSPAAKKKAAAKPARSADKAEGSAAAKPAKRGGTKKSQRILRIRLRSFDYKQIDTASDVILRTVRQTGSDIRGPIPLPVSRERYDLLRSPHVFKDSREQIEIRTYHRLVDILEPSKKTVEAMVKIELPNGVDANMKVI